jgi:hypothetical protein
LYENYFDDIFDASDKVKDNLDDEHVFTGVTLAAYIYIFENNSKTDKSILGSMIELMRLTQKNNLEIYKNKYIETNLYTECIIDNKKKLLKYFFNFLKKYKLQIIKLFNWKLMKNHLYNYLKTTKQYYGVYPTYKTHFKGVLHEESLCFFCEYFGFVFCE